MHHARLLIGKLFVLPVVTNSLLYLVSITFTFSTETFAAQNQFWDLCRHSGSRHLHCDSIRKICSQVANVKIPPQDKPTDQEKLLLKGCSSDKLYYGYGNTSDPINARKCAFMQVEQNNADGVFDGTPILMTVYANGEGVKRDLDIALKFACDDESHAAAEFEGRVEHILQMKHETRQQRFDYCEDITSGYMSGICANRQASLDNALREIQYTRLFSKWSTGEKRSFEKMQFPWKSYLKAREAEIDQSGTDRGAMIIADQELLKKKFLSDLSDYEEGKMPKFSEHDSKRVDQELNFIYKKIQGGKENQVSGTVTRENIKLAQRAWLKYRDAWLVFAKLKYPAVSEAAWNTKLTRDRVELLKEFIN